MALVFHVVLIMEIFACRTAIHVMWDCILHCCLSVQILYNKEDFLNLFISQKRFNVPKLLFLAWKITQRILQYIWDTAATLYYCDNCNQRPEVLTPPHTSPLALITKFSLAFVFGAELGVWYVLCALQFTTGGQTAPGPGGHSTGGSAGA